MTISTHIRPFCDNNKRPKKEEERTDRSSSAKQSTHGLLLWITQDQNVEEEKAPLRARGIKSGYAN